MTVWICGLLYSCWCVVIGISGLISARTTGERSHAIGQFGQGILLTFVAGGAYYGDSMAIGLGAGVVLGLLIIYALLGQATMPDDVTLSKDESA